MSLRINYAITFAGKCALVFAPIYLIALLLSGFAVSGTGSAPAITEFLWKYATLAERSLGLEFSLVPIVLAWSLVVFVAAFLMGLAIYRVPAESGRPSRSGQSQSTVTWILVAVVGAIVVVVNSRWQKQTEENNRAQVVEFVRSNPQVIEEAGDVSRLSIVSIMNPDNDRPTYDVAVWSKPPLYAIVSGDFSGSSPSFTLVCTTRLYMGQRDVRKGPCEQ